MKNIIYVLIAIAVLASMFVYYKFSTNKNTNMSKTMSIERIKEGDFKYYQLEVKVGKGVSGEVYFNDTNIYTFTEKGGVTSDNRVQKLKKQGENSIRLKINNVNDITEKKILTDGLIDISIFGLNTEDFAKKDDTIVKILWNPNEEAGNDVTYTFNLD